METLKNAAQGSNVLADSEEEARQKIMDFVMEKDGITPKELAGIAACWELPAVYVHVNTVRAGTHTSIKVGGVNTGNIAVGNIEVNARYKD
ncbi:MAG: hypothetical protein LBJ14_10390 [Desulfarculales bacterium]|jgi:hypothetical protein|nr:hypothetical protein [Desulfarculales bacterium]